MKYLLPIALAALMGLFGSAPDACAAPYVVDAARSELVVRLFKSGIASPLAHDHVIRATEFAGEADLNFENPSVSTLWVEAQAGSLAADEPAMREKYSVEKAISDKDRRKVQETMLSKSQMDVQTYPTVRFESTHIEKKTEGQYLVTGMLIMHGGKKAISFPAVVLQKEGVLHGQASFRFKQSDFGIKPYSAFFGSVRNQDEAVMNIELVLAPKELAD